MKIPTISTLFFSRYSEPSNQSLPKSIQPVKDVEKKQLLPSALREDLGSGCFLRNSSCLATQVLTPTKKKNIATSTQVTIESERILEKQKKKKENFMTPFRPPFFVGIKKMVGSFTRGFLIATDYKGKKKLS